MASNRDKRLRRKVRHSYMLSTASITLVLFLLGIVGYGSYKAINNILDPAMRVTLSVDIADGLYDNEQDDVRDAILSLKEVDGVTLVTNEDRYNRSEIPFEVDMELLGGKNPLHDCFEVTLKQEYADMHHINTVVDKLLAIANVVYVDKPDSKYLEQSSQSVSVIIVVLLVFSAVLFVISMLLLNNTLRLAIYSKRYLINTMKLVGATKWYIMRPMLASAFKQGLLSGLIASLMTCAMIYGVVDMLPEGVATTSYEELGMVAGIVTAMGVVITVCFSAMAINKFVNMKSNKIHLY